MKVCESSYEARDSSLPVIARLLGKLSCGLSGESARSLRGVCAELRGVGADSGRLQSAEGRLRGKSVLVLVWSEAGTWVTDVYVASVLFIIVRF